jgi:hypothetical protein
MLRFVLCAALAFGAGAARAAEEDPESAEAVRRARAELARELGRPREDLVVEGAAFVRFQDGALGCPRPGEGTSAVVTPGWRVALRLDAERYDVRVAADGTSVRVCGKLAAKARPAPAVLADMAAAASAADAARRQLSALLQVPSERVRRVWARPVRWPADHAGCDHPGKAEAGSGTHQFLVLLEHAGVERLYRVDGPDATSCPPAAAGSR